jgi:hypothetical protein
MAEKMPSSVKVGSRPIRSRMRWYSSGLSPARNVAIDPAGQRRGGERAVELGIAGGRNDDRLGQGLRLAARDDQQARGAGGVEFGDNPVGGEVAILEPAGMGLAVDLLQRRNGDGIAAHSRRRA